MKKTYELSMKIWMLLVCAARERKSYTYESLAKTLGMGGVMDARRMAKYLEPIMHYCNQNDYHPLTVLVVGKNTGVPGDGLVIMKNKNQDMNLHREKVFKADWLALKTPTASDFQTANEPQK